MAGDIQKDMVIMFNNAPHIVVSKEFYSPAKGGSFTRTKLKNLTNGKILSHTFRTGEKLDEVNIELRTMQFLYSDESLVYFMDPKSFEQISVALDSIDGGTDYLHTEAKYIIMFFDEKVIGVRLPIKITLSVRETAGGVRGDTVSNATKEATLESGMKIQVPLFIKEGDKIIINTETGKYVEKV